MPKVTISSLLSVSAHPEGPEGAFCASPINQQREAAAYDGWGWVGRAKSASISLLFQRVFSPGSWEAAPLGENTGVPRIPTGRSDEGLGRRRLFVLVVLPEGSRVNFLLLALTGCSFLVDYLT